MKAFRILKQTMVVSKYICPMHQEIRSDSPGKCPKCGMDLVLEGSKAIVAKRTVKDFLPLIIIFSFIFAFTVIRQFFLGGFDILSAMSDFMGSFFLLFGFFKVLNWKGFVDAYVTYDIVAKKSRAYAYFYPLLELGLGVFFIFRLYLLPVNIITLVIMLIGSIGVLKELRAKNQIMCACLGVVFKLPMTWVTFIEDIVMAVMATIMILMLVL